MTTPYQQKMTGIMHYPSRGTLNRLMFKTPLILFRMGLGPLLGRLMLVLTTWGRKSGLPRHTMLEYGTIGNTRYLTAGWGARSDWYRNIQANPHVTVQVGRGVEYAIARRVTDPDEVAEVLRPMVEHGGDAYSRPWLESLGIRFDLDDLIAKRDRLVVMALDPSDEPGPPPMGADLKWLGPTLAGVLTLGWLIGRSGRR